MPLNMGNIFQAEMLERARQSLLEEGLNNHFSLAMKRMDTFKPAKVMSESTPNACVISTEKFKLKRGEPESYTFKVGDYDGISINKIKDDLSYDDPMRIVESGNDVWVVIHHSIQDKAGRSVYDNPLHGGILHGHAYVSKSDIKNIVKQIRAIKQAQWLKPKVDGDLKVVTVTKIKI